LDLDGGINEGANPSNLPFLVVTYYLKSSLPTFVLMNKKHTFNSSGSGIKSYSTHPKE
jgi:hypothetical protein